MNLDGVTATASLDGFDLDGLLNEAQEMDGVETSNVPVEAEAKPVLEERQVDWVTKSIVTSFEMALKTFGNERYVMPESKKEMLTAVYSDLIKEHESKVPAAITDYATEIAVVVVTLIVFGSGYMTVRELRRQDAERIIEAQGGKDAS